MIEELHIQNFRCFEDITISSIGQVNLIVGKNNIGKTSLLEAIHLYANSGNVWSIHQILNKRQDSFHPTPNTQFNQQLNSMEARGIFDTTSNIFNKENILQSCLIKSQNTEIAIEKANDISKLKELKGINQNPMLFQQGDGFYIELNRNVTPYFIISTPSTIINDINGVGDQLPINAKLYHCNSYNYDVSSFADLWGILDDCDKSEYINDVIKTIDSRILRAYYTPKREAKVKLEGYAEAQKLASLGEGTTRIFQLFILAYSAEGGILTIDEFENGLHYSIQEDIFRELFKITKELGAQVFITTHSADTIKAFSKVANEEDEVHARLIGLARSEKKSTKGRIFSITYKEHEMKSFIELGMEVRK